MNIQGLISSRHTWRGSDAGQPPHQRALTGRLGVGLLMVGSLGLMACSSPEPSAAPTTFIHGTVTGNPDASGQVAPHENASFPTPYPGSAPVVVEVEDNGDIDVISIPVDDVLGRGRRRMNIDQLEASIKQVSNGLTWTEVASNGVETDLFQSLSLTLGKPDFIQSTTEDLSASLLFEKFLSDAANNVCRKLAEKEVTQSMDQRVLMMVVEPDQTLDSAPELVDENMRLLLRHYHGRNYEPASVELDPWLWLFESATHVSNSPSQGWRAVCVGLMTHPDFFSF